MKVENNSSACDKSSNPAFENVILKRFKHLLESDDKSDCDFIVGPTKMSIRGHKLIFSLASEVFDAMFFSDLKEDSVVNIVDLEPDGFLGMKHFIYTGTTDFKSVTEALLTFMAAHKYLINQLCDECIKYVEKNIQPCDVLECYEFCKNRNIPDFNEICFNIIQNETDAVVHSEYFLSIEVETIKLILGFTTLKLDSEVSVFKHFERWAKAEAGRRKSDIKGIANSLKPIFKQIRFTSMNLTEFSHCVKSCPLLSNEEAMYISINIFTNKVLDSTKKQRNFLPVNHLTFKFNHSFDIHLKERSVECSDLTFNFLDRKWRINVFYFKENFCFNLLPNFSSVDFSFLIKFNSHLIIEGDRIQRRAFSDSENENLPRFELKSECHEIYKWDTNLNPNNGMIFAAIKYDVLRRYSQSMIFKQSWVELDGNFEIECFK
ncbi:BTB/POZ domain-containing protein 3-like [Nilaparvata lugens]|uniref:BTB/POZ domain-containing protein 3-like n=1 Tax=Nilaparvata lugens TaxID=108931 RepID=UPI00193D462E|nr:BTB/POZ domain-containing protein 3-like [Nilaparvata lugens]